MVIKSEISYNPISLKSLCKICMSLVKQKMNCFFLIHLLKFTVSPKFLFWLFMGLLFFNFLSYFLSSFCLYHKQATIKNNNNNRNHQQHMPYIWVVMCPCARQLVLL